MNEGVEIAVDASDTTSTYRILIYDGANRNLLTTISNAATQNTVAGVKYMVFATPSIQNGLEGIALVDQNNIVVEFLSYTGSFTANNGPASGKTSIDIGVKETSTTPIDHSLQRVIGTSIWTWPLLRTPGLPNQGAMAAP